MTNFKNLKVEIVFKKQFLTLFFITIVTKSAWAQQAYPITDAQPLLINGLQIGYQIKSQEVKKVGDKGDFSRYAVTFYVTNTMSEPKVILFREGWQNGGNASPQVARFNVLNATGARLTSNAAFLNADPCSVIALVDDRECGTNRNIQNKRLVQIGYWIRPGQTISSNEIVIVPLNEAPKVEAYYTANAEYAPAQPVSVQPPPLVNMQAQLRLKNMFNNTYINNQNSDLPASTGIQSGWLSARWELVPVPGSNFVNIKNRWKGNFLDIDGSGVIRLSPNVAAPTSVWAFEPTHDANIFVIKNIATGGYLCLINNNLALSNNRNDPSFGWLLENP